MGVDVGQDGPSYKVRKTRKYRREHWVYVNGYAKYADMDTS